MPTPLMFRALARVTSNSGLVGLGYATLLLTQTGEEVTCRTLVHVAESVEDELRRAVVKTTHWCVIREDLVAATSQGVIRSPGAVQPGSGQVADQFRDQEGRTWDIRNAVRPGDGTWRCDLVEVQARTERPARR